MMRPIIMSDNEGPHQRGFSLVEMAIVMLVLVLLLGGLLPTLSGQIEQQRRNETRKQMDEIISALLGYASSQQPPRLPCPARPGIATGSANAGLADCTLTSGVVPWVTLGTNETDAWGRRFTYAVTAAFASSSPAVTLSSAGNLTIRNQAGAGGSNVATNIPAAIISHGSNGNGAFTPLGTQLPASADPDEADNANGTPFVSHDSTPAFDDLVIWLSPNTFFNRMVAAGKLP